MGENAITIVLFLLLQYWLSLVAAIKFLHSLDKSVLAKYLILTY